MLLYRGQETWVDLRSIFAWRSVFSFGNHVIRFKAPYSLERYTSVKEWDNGYLVVMAKYRHNSQPEEEYIDLLPILNRLYINGQEFLKPIKEVAIANG